MTTLHGVGSTDISMGKLEPEDAIDILGDSLQSLYGFTPIVHSSGGSIWTYMPPEPPKHLPPQPVSIRLRVPDTSAKNWNLHASSVWVAAVYIADQIYSDANWLSTLLSPLDLTPTRKIRILEIGAGAGLPTIAIAKQHHDVIQQAILSDFPDDGITRALEENVEMNFPKDGLCAKQLISVAPFDWMDPSPQSFDLEPGFDLIIGADVLWNSGLHHPILLSVDRCLRQELGATVLLVAGLHTGRYTIQRFLDLVHELEAQLSLHLKYTEEREAKGSLVREWDPHRQESESEEERRRWIVSICLVRAKRISPLTTLPHY
jgi:nicotinamide N-methyltransferase